MKRHAPRFLQVDGGFTLLEILVAISIMAICLTVIFQLFSGGLKSGRLSDDYTRGVFHAREIMEEILVSDDLAEGISEGRFNDSYAWKAEVVRVEQKEEEKSKLPLDTFIVKVQVTWGETERKKRFELETMKVQEKQEEEATK
ncbi:MAG TPA: type II secretion system protein [Deltaproteobacteria bacterium]|nr:type II secretion system protein [Deltaproteobacteria bacterium]